MPEVRVGIPSVIHALLLPALIGVGATNWLLLTGENIDADQALRWGLVEFVVPPDALDALVERNVAALVAGAPLAIRSQKALIRHWESASLQAGLEDSVTAFGAAYDTDEPARYMAPFVARKSG
jgi:enoyl-CoA hydratase/carnithine racemase